MKGLIPQKWTPSSVARTRSQRGRCVDSGTSRRWAVRLQSGAPRLTRATRHSLNSNRHASRGIGIFILFYSIFWKSGTRYRRTDAPWRCAAIGLCDRMVRMYVNLERPSVALTDLLEERSNIASPRGRALACSMKVTQRDDAHRMPLQRIWKYFPVTISRFVLSCPMVKPQPGFAAKYILRGRPGEVNTQFMARPTPALAIR